MFQIKCIDTNGRKFSLMSEVPVDEAWIARQNVNRAKVGRAAIVSWECEAI